MHASSSFHRAWLAVLAIVTALGAATLARAESGDVLGPSDSIRVTILQSPELTTETRLSTQGTILMPLIGSIELGGLSSSDAAARIAQRYRDGQFLRDPQVTVTILTMRSRQVSVLGQVTRPGRYAIDEIPPRVTDMLALAGGISPTGDDTTVTVVTHRDGQPKKITLNLTEMMRNADVAANIELTNGDMIFVQRAPVFYIYGQVQRAGSYRIDGNLNVMQAVSLGGGITLRGTERGMKIHRRTADGSVSRIDAKPFDPVQPDDVIYVSESFF